MPGASRTTSERWLSHGLVSFRAFHVPRDAGDYRKERRGFEILEDAGTIGGNVHSSFGIDDSATVKRVLSWVDSIKPGQRLFVTYLPVSGHHPYISPEPATATNSVT